MTLNAKHEVMKHIERERGDIVAFLQRLISIPSETGNEKGIQRFIAKKLTELDLSLDVWEPDIRELRKHSGYVPVAGDYRNRPNVQILSEQFHQLFSSVLSLSDS